MYKITIQLPNEIIETTINDITEVERVLAPYAKIYTGFSATKMTDKIEQKENNMAKYNYEFKPTITDFDIDWMKIKSACMTTISKQAGSKEPSEEWKKKLLMCQHSPLRRGSISWKWEEIPYCISTHFVRHHEGVEKWIGTSRADRTEIKDRSERTQMDMVPMEMEANIQALINISERRLCTCADPLTIKYWKGVLEAVREFDEDIYWACVPQCIRMGACPEQFSPCGFFEKFAEGLTKEELMDMKTRYDKYNEMRGPKKVLKK